MHARPSWPPKLIPIAKDGIRRCWPVSDGLAEKAADELHNETRRPSTFVEKGIELHDVDRSHQPGIVQELHDEMGLAIGRASGDRGAHSWRHGRIEEIDIETHMQNA